FADDAFDACVSQEALLHIADKRAVLEGCRRALVPGGRLAFTDWIAHPRLAERERDRLREWMAATTLQSLPSYHALLGRAGFTAHSNYFLSRSRTRAEGSTRTDGEAAVPVTLAVTSPRPWFTTMSRAIRPLASAYSPATATFMTRLV